MPDGLPTATVILKPRRARPFFGRHPWVLDSAVDRVDGDPTDGTVVDLLTHDGKFVARGLWNSQSRLRVRLYGFDADTRLDDALWQKRLATAVALRQQLGLDGRLPVRPAPPRRDERRERTPVDAAVER